MSLEELKAAFEKARLAKEAMNATVNPLRAKRDAVVQAMAPMEREAAELAKQIQAHMPAMVEIDKRLSSLAEQLGHPRVGGAPQLFKR